MIDLHLHTTFSDGTDSPKALLKKTREAGLSLFSVTDHDGIAGMQEIIENLEPGDPDFITGVEFSCKDEKGKYHILGYGFNPGSHAIVEVIRRGHEYRMKKQETRLRRLQEEFGFQFPEERVREILSLDNPGKPHVANLMMEFGYAGTKEEAINEYIDRLKFKSDYVRPEEAIRGIIEGGGIPILAHPVFGDGSQLIDSGELAGRIARLKGAGLAGVEGYYERYDTAQREEILVLAEEHDLYVTAGSDYHGGNKNVKLGDTRLETGGGDMPAGLKRFLEDVNIVQK